MNGFGINSASKLNHSLLFCHACLTSSRTLTMVGNYIDIYLKICDNVRMNVTSQVTLCWECMAMLKKIWAFKKKVENAQKILDYGKKKKACLPGLTYLTQSETETTTYPMDEDEDDCDDLDKSDVRLNEDLESDVRQHDDLDKTDMRDELMIRIEDVRGYYEVEKQSSDMSFNSSSGCDVMVKVEPLSPEPDYDEVNYQRWKRAALLIYRRICDHSYAQHFLKPVSDEVAPLYSKVIREPTDLGTIRKQIKDGVIRTTAQLERELLLMFSNALMYNSKHHDIYRMALELRARTLRELSLLSAAESSSPPCPALRRASPAPRAAPAPPAPPTTPAALRRRRASLWTEPRRHDHALKESNARLDPPAASIRRRRASERPAPPAAPTPAPAATPAPTPAPPARRRPSWTWTSLELDTELLEPRHFSKICKTVLL